MTGIQLEPSRRWVEHNTLQSLTHMKKDTLPSEASEPWLLPLSYSGLALQTALDCSCKELQAGTLDAARKALARCHGALPCTVACGPTLWGPRAVPQWKPTQSRERPVCGGTSYWKGFVRGMV